MITKNIIFIYSWLSLIIWIFINNLTNEIKTSLLVLLILVVLFLCYFIIIKKFLKLFIFIILSFLIWILISTNNLNNINKKEKLLKNYYNDKNYELTFEVISLNKVTKFTNEYLSQIKQIWGIKIDKNINSIIKLDSNNEIKKQFICFQLSKHFQFSYEYLIKNYDKIEIYAKTRNLSWDEKEILIWKIENFSWNSTWFFYLNWILKRWNYLVYLKKFPISKKNLEENFENWKWIGVEVK